MVPGVGSQHPGKERNPGVPWRELNEVEIEQLPHLAARPKPVMRISRVLGVTQQSRRLRYCCDGGLLK